jgi:hypothetical protein
VIAIHDLVFLVDIRDMNMFTLHGREMRFKASEGEIHGNEAQIHQSSLVEEGALREPGRMRSRHPTDLHHDGAGIAPTVSLLRIMPRPLMRGSKGPMSPE